jgi:uncharacterized protein Yka (UPF0111/DUF47 family)
LITSIDNVADRLHGASSIMRLYQVDTKSIRKLTEINLEACQNIDSAVKELSNLKNMKLLKRHVKLIKLKINQITFITKQFSKF